MAPKGRVVRHNILKAGALSSRAPSHTQPIDGDIRADEGSTDIAPRGSANVAPASRGILLNSDSLNTTPAGSTTSTPIDGMSLVAGNAVGGSTNATSAGSTNGTPVGGFTGIAPVGGDAISVTRLPYRFTTLTIRDG